jgi:carbonic anhydrase
LWPPVSWLLDQRRGDAVVIRNLGGRITPGLLEPLGLLGRIGEVAREIPGGGGELDLIVLQRTACGITRLARDPALLAHYFQLKESEVEATAVTDPSRGGRPGRFVTPGDSRIAEPLADLRPRR